MIKNYTGISGGRVAYYAAAESAKVNKSLIIVSSGAVAERLREDLAFFVRDPIFVLPEEDDVQFLYEARDTDRLARRLAAQRALISDDRAIVIAPVSAALREIPVTDVFAGMCIRAAVGERVNPSELRRRLTRAGYEYSELTESFGEFSLRGGIIDVFAAGYDDPVRIEFFGDEIDSIRSFDKETQRSIESMDEVVIPPAVLYMPDDDEIDAALLRIKDTHDSRVYELVSERMSSQIYAELIECFDVETCRLWDYAPDAVRMAVDPVRIYETMGTDRDESLLFPLFDGNTVIFTPFSERVQGADRIDELVNVVSHDMASFNGRLPLLEKEVRDRLRSGFEIHIVSSSQERLDRLREYIEEAAVFGRVRYETGSLGNGFVLNDEKKCYITEQDIFPDIRKKPLNRRRRSGGKIDFSDFEKGDYVVHEQHGIGRFEGIETIDADGEVNDFIKIRYAESDVLYIPVDQMDIIQKYIGNEGKAPTLSHLTGGSWRRTRERARRAVMEIAQDLVKLYAEREASGGYAFSEDTVWQTEFEDSFPFTETDDQLRAIREIKEDMQKPVPMDRLLCGDVGYGKTEVAARAIFKCISEGKQAALLAPTTILVNQHYMTLKRRLADYPFNVEMLSRFNSEADNERILRELASGSVDLVVGTHKLLSGKVKFRDLGLLVVDEEQRFGVKHKERIKMMRHDIDVLTLSATPIPRTLNMSLTGIKNISMIEEPPEDRYPVQTFVTPEDEELISSVIRRELARDGQVYVVNNRIAGIKQLAERIGELVPEAEIAVGHGRMNETALENVMMDFIEGKTNVLVATTIIENGIDIPNANTIIILNADMLGLSQLYQLRGRVGRSSRLAYAYLMYKPQKVMTELAHKRLTAIRDFTEFGAGFKVAMRDLELRGAGNILGEAQHGHIAGIGYELYCKEVDRAVKALSGEAVPMESAEVAIEVDVPARIPVEYISNETLKLQAYRRIAQIDSEEMSDDVIGELIDRYGDLPEVTLNLIRIAEVRSHAEFLGIETVQERGTHIVVTPGAGSRVDAYTLIFTKEDIGEPLVITSGVQPSLDLYVGNKRKLTKLLGLMRSLRKNAEESRRRSGDR